MSDPGANPVRPAGPVTDAEPSAAIERLRAARDAYPQGHCGDDVGRLMVRVRAADVDAVLAGIRNYELTMKVIAEEGE